MKTMKNITARNFRILCDFMDVYQFMTETYNRNWQNGVPAPFFEYALSSDWMAKPILFVLQKTLLIIFIFHFVLDMNFLQTKW